jgi:uncharacterized protein YprB with RNaseH-like and TPR domain
MDLIEKLRQIQPDSSDFHRETVNRSGPDIQQIVPGEIVDTPRGSFFRSSDVYPLDYRYGDAILESIWDVDPEIFGRVAKDEALCGVDLRKAVFLDTETTGLAGGTGTVPFLIGLGYFSNDGFRIEQFFMRDYHEEQAVLYAVQNKLRDSAAIVSYNGKGYDLNILSARFILARMNNPADNLPHLDLLFSVRRLWRRRIHDCSLTNVERSILSFHRENDIPSFLIPSIYFNYLRDRNANPLVSIFQHNRLDITALAALSGIIGRIYQDPKHNLTHSLDFYSLGRALENLTCFEEASQCYREALNYSISHEQEEDLLEKLGFSLKRSDDWDQAVKVWEHMILTYPHRLSAYEELAKYHEHRTRQYENAIQVVHSALERIQIQEELRGRWASKVDMKDLEYRLARLMRKAGREY